MSLLPVIRHCQKTCRTHLVVRRNTPRHSPLFKMLDNVDDDYLGKHLQYSSTPNCIIHKTMVIAKCDLNPGTELTVAQPITKFLDSL